MKRIISPSVLSADFSKLAEEIKTVENAGAEYLHIDIMDGHFVDNITFGPLVVGSMRKCTNMFFDVHLMIENQENYIERFAKAGADMITFHLEATENPLALIKQIRKAGVKVGITIKPGTPVEEVIKYAELTDMVLIMTVEPGKGGQKLIPECLEKVKFLREKFPDMDISVDGGVKTSNIKDVALAGANIIVAGSAVFCAENPDEVIKYMLEA